MASVRKTLDRLIRKAGIGYAGASRLIGKNPAYIQQFIKRGTPRQLAEGDRHILANHFGVNEQLLSNIPLAGASLHGGREKIPPPSLPATTGTAVADRFLDIPYIGDPLQRMMAVSGELVAELENRENPAESPGEDPGQNLLALRLSGDAMAPTLLHDDHLLIYRQEGAPLRDGLYLIDMNGTLTVRRIARQPAAGKVSIISDNSAYPDFTDFPSDKLNVIGRVAWISRFLL